MTSFVLLFPDGEDRYLVLPYFWLPEDNRLPEHQVWADQGFLRLTPGSTCDYSFVKRDIVALAKKFNIREFGFDDYNAEQLTQDLHEQHDIQRVNFPQTISAFAGPTSEFERLVISRGLVHNGHPILSLQAGHVTVKQDANANMRPVKPRHGDHRKIDGIVASIMALGVAMANNDTGSVYDQKGQVICY